MCMWSLHQDDDFYDEKKNSANVMGGGIWNILTSELDVTEPQKLKILGLRDGIKAQRRRLRESLRMLNQLEKHVRLA